MSRESVFITTTSETTTHQFSLTRNERIVEIKLNGFSISGVPTTSGVPDHLFYNLAIESAKGSITRYSRNDGYSDIPLPIEAGFTYHFHEPMVLYDTSMPFAGSLDKLSFKLTDSTHSTPTFSRLCLWFTVTKQ